MTPVANIVYLSIFKVKSKTNNAMKTRNVIQLWSLYLS